MIHIIPDPEGVKVVKGIMLGLAIVTVLYAAIAVVWLL